MKQDGPKGPVRHGEAITVSHSLAYTTPTMSTVEGHIVKATTDARWALGRHA